MIKIMKCRKLRTCMICLKNEIGYNDENDVMKIHDMGNADS